MIKGATYYSTKRDSLVRRTEQNVETRFAVFVNPDKKGVKFGVRQSGRMSMITIVMNISQQPQPNYRISDFGVDRHLPEGIR